MEHFITAFIFMGFATYRDGKTAQARMVYTVTEKCGTKIIILFYCILYYKVKKRQGSPFCVYHLI